MERGLHPRETEPAQAALFAFGVHHLLHHLLGLLKLSDQLIDVLHGGAGTGGDALPAGSVQEGSWSG